MRNILLCGAAAIFCAPAPLVAQEAADPVVTASGDEIVVTARKRAESIVNVPISIEAVSGSKLEALAIRDVESAAKLVPNLYVDKVAAGPRVSIRGLGNSQTGGQVDSSVGLGIDGVFYGRPRWLQIGLFDLESFEVLRGPQSTYFGKNSTAGLINIRTRGPGDRLEGYAVAGHEFAFKGWNGEAALGGPVTDTLGVRLAYRHNETDGFLRTIGTDARQPNSRDDIVRASVRWKPSDGVQADYKLTYFKSRIDGNGQEVGVCSDAYRASLMAAGSPEDCVLDYRKAPENIYPVGIVPKGFYTRNKGTSQSLALSADVGGGLTLSSVTGYNDLQSDWVSDGDWGALSIFNIYRPERNKQFSQEFRVQSEASKPVAVVVGAYYEHVSKRFSGIADGPGFGNISFFKLLRAKANSVAIFGEVTARPVEGVSLIAGGRYTDIDQKGRLTADFGSLGDLGTGPETDATRKLPTDNFSPSVTAQYEFNRRAQIYASFKKGFKSGGFSIDGANPTYKDEKATSYELGAKVESADRRLLLSASLYRTDVSNMQVQAYAGTSPTSDITNVASARLEGLEVGARYRLSSQLGIDANMALSDAKYRRFPGAPCTIGQACPGGQQDLSGARLPLAPRRSFSLGADYRQPVVGDHELALNASVTHRSAVQLAIENDPLTRSPALTLADARIAIEPGDGSSGFSIALVGRNIFDKKYVVGAIALPAADNFVYQVGVPRTVELQIGYRF